MQRVPAEFYDEEYFVAGTKSNYAPYGPGDWADGLVRMILEYDKPSSVLDVGCATGLVVSRLNDAGVPAQGFDISAWAVKKANSPNVWNGTVEDAESYREVDLITASELAEHLTPEQAEAMFKNALAHADRMLCLIAAYRDGEPEVEPHHEKDKSHINLKSMDWWRSLAESVGWKVVDSSRFDNDAKSVAMSWNGRFLYLAKA